MNWNRIGTALVAWGQANPGGALIAGVVVAGFVLTRCPSCLIGTRTPRVNRRSGVGFTGCSRYPACKYTGS